MTADASILNSPKPGRARSTPKGRQVDPAARARLNEILGKTSRQRDLLIEHLHRIQDTQGCLPEDLLAALADEMKLALAEVYEVATFYHNFEVTKEPAPRPHQTIKICDSLPCALAGAKALMEMLKQDIHMDVRITHAACMGRCDHAPIARIGHTYVEQANSQRILNALQEHTPLTPTQTSTPGLAHYRATGGYALYDALREGRQDLEQLISALDEANLRGLGGAGFPTARKWRMVRAQLGRKLMAVNADESEPGTFKDRHFLLTDPHRFLEGMLIAAHVVAAERIYIFLRDEYADIRLLLEAALIELHDHYPNLPPIELRRGAGAYICGEESAMLESLEGKRALPRHKPPFPSEVGLFGQPTLINNVETLFWVRDIVERGATWYSSQGRRGHKGPRAFSVSGRVRKPGVKLAPAGITLSELIEDYCGGMLPGHQLKAYLPGGASGGILPASLANLPLDFGTLEKYGCFIGSAAIIVLSDHDNIGEAALNLMRFFEDESCGQCTPCRLGATKAATLMNKTRWDEAILADLVQVMADASICGLGQAAPNGLRSVLSHFRKDVGLS